MTSTTVLPSSSISQSLLYNVYLDKVSCSVELCKEYSHSDVVETEKVHHLTTQMTAMSNGEQQEPISDDERLAS